MVSKACYVPMLCSLSESSSCPLVGGMLVKSLQTALAACHDADATTLSIFRLESRGSWLNCDTATCAAELPNSSISATDTEEKCLADSSASAVVLAVRSLSSSDSRSRSSSLFSLHLSKRPRPKNASYIKHNRSTLLPLHR